MAGLVVGDREVSRHFDLTLRGLYGSLIALLLVTAASAYLPVLMGRPGGMLLGILGYGLLLSMQIGFSAIVLLQVKRLDGFVPYFTADNWASVYVTVGSTALSLMGISDEFLSVPIAVLVIVIAVNIGRLIIRLEPLQVAMFVVAQMVGAVIGSFVLSLFVPVSS